jgi:pimeloyl-ACP methyl ester carboxylesterase
MTDAASGQAQRFEVDVPVPGQQPSGALHVWVRGTGAPVLALHGGPGLSASYLEPLVDELGPAYQVASYQQRGLPPSTATGPYDVAVQVADAVAVLDALGWERAVVVGHSWGGHLLLHLLAAVPHRLTAAVLVDPLGGVDDGGLAEFAAELLHRIPADQAVRVQALEERLDAGEGTLADAQESFRLVWPAYFADPATAPPMPAIAQSVTANLETFGSLIRELPELTGRLAGLPVPTTFLHGGASPMPLTASSATADVIGPAARLVVLPDTGHFVWHESPGAVRAAVDAAMAATTG